MFDDGLDLSWIWGPLLYVARADKRVFLGFMVSATLFILVKGFWTQGQLRRDLSAFFSPKTWFHPSSRVDVQCLLFNNWSFALLILPVIWNVEDMLIWVAHGLDLVFGHKFLLNDWPQGVVTLIYTVTLFVCSDLSRYLLHYALHRYPWLWRFHKVHHSAEVLTPMTVYRAHPVEMLLYRFRALLVVGSISGVFFFLFGGKMKIWAILGVNGLGFLFNLLGANLRHSRVWLGFGPLEKVFISPAQHQMHHSQNLSMSKTNLGSCLALWDRALGTFRASKTVGESERANFGLAPERSNHDPRSWLSSFWRPFVDS